MYTWLSLIIYYQSTLTFNAFGLWKIKNKHKILIVIISNKKRMKEGDNLNIRHTYTQIVNYTKIRLKKDDIYK